MKAAEQNLIHHRIVGEFLIKRELIGSRLIYNAYRRIYQLRGKANYKELKSYQGKLYGKMTSHITQDLTAHCYPPIEKAFPESSIGEKLNGLIIVDKSKLKIPNS